MMSASDGKKSAAKPNVVSKPAEPTKSTEMLDAVEGQSHSNIEKIRTILFGNQMRDYEVRFHRLEEQLSKDVAELREDFRRRNDAIEGYVRQELEALSERLAGEYEGRKSSLREVSKSLEELSHGLEERTHHLEEQLSRSNRELRQQVLTQGKQLRDEVQLSLSELGTLLQQELQQLRGSKTDRNALAGLLTDLAARLSADTP